MESKTDILNELFQLSPLLSRLDKCNVYIVPLGYFEFLEANVLSHIKKDILPGISRSPVYEVPQGYFESLSIQVLERIRSGESFLAAGEESSTLPTILEGLNQKPVYTVPEGYFEQNPAAILERIQKPVVKITGFNRTRFIIQYAAAAIIIGVLALGTYKFINRGSGNNNQEDKQMARIILDAGKIKDVDQEINNLSDEDIINYLQSNNQSVDDALVATLVDDKDLPEQEDYLLDDHALDNFLNGENKQELNN